MTFSELGVAPELLKALAAEGITEPTAVQKMSAELLMEGKDVFISSETGTGKTLAYLLPLLMKLDLESNGLQHIIVAPTHELAVQVQEQLQRLAQVSGLGFRSLLLIGETPVKRQLEKLKKKPHLVVGSPGRLLELIKMRKLKVHTVKSIVVDEIDRLLTGELLESIRKIVKATLKERQLIFVSATDQKPCLDIAERLSPALIKVNARTSQTNTDITHLFFVEEERKKIDFLRRLIRAIEPKRAIVFVHRNQRADLLVSKLEHHKLKVVQIHKECTKLERKQALDDFRKGLATVLISSDIASRGLDIKGVSHVFNLDIPSKSEDYVHRSGRTGRAGAKGFAISLTTVKEISLIKKHAQKLKIKIKEADMRQGKVEIVDE